MSFEHATVTRGVMLGLAITSVSAGIFDVKHYLHLQIIPHLSKHHQYWRLFVHHFACVNSSDLLLTELLLYNVGVPIERAFGSIKFASFMIVNLLTTMIVTYISLLTLHFLTPLGHLVNHIPSGPFSVLFGLVYQYMRLVPPAYQFKIFGADFTDKIWVYAIAIQLAASYAPTTVLLAMIGIFSGYLYRSDIVQLKGWRVPHRLAQTVNHWSTTLLGDGRATRRINRVLPDSSNRSGAGWRPTDGTEPENTEVVTTARPAQPSALPTPRNTLQSDASNPARTPTEPRTPDEEATSSGVMRQWVSELTGGARPSAGGVGTVRAPSQSEVQILTAMFPDVGRDVILGVLQRSPNIEAAAETLLLGAQS